VSVEICALSGLLPTPDCPYRRWEWFIEGTQPTQPDNFYQLVEIDSSTGRLADENTPPERRVEQVVLDLPAEARPWAHREGLVLLSDLLAASEGGGGLDTLAPLRIVSPAQGSLYLLDPALDTETQKLLIEAVGDAGFENVSLWVDGELIGTFDRAPYQIWWSLVVGAHEVWAEGIREDGERAVSEVMRFEVE
jgi:hypothetical protein